VIDGTGARPDEAFAGGDRRRRRVAMVPEGGACSQTDGAGKFDARRVPQAARRDIDRNLAQAFETFPVLKDQQKQLAGTMSGRQQQMLAIARALMSRRVCCDRRTLGWPVAAIWFRKPSARSANSTRASPDRADGRTNFNQAIRIANRGYIKIVHGEIVVAAVPVDELKAMTSSAALSRRRSLMAQVGATLPRNIGCCRSTLRCVC